MITQKSIPDVYILDLERKGARLVVLHETHYLLRRFGQVEYVELNEGGEIPFTLREVADEVWSVLTGKVFLILVDKRQGSPSENVSMRLELSENQPQAVLIPFGVAYQIKVVQDSHLLRITTHADGMHEGDRVFSQDEVDTTDATT